MLLPCEASGIPRPSIRWQKEGLSVPAGESPWQPAWVGGRQYEPAVLLPAPASPPALPSPLTTPGPLVLPEHSVAGLGGWVRLPCSLCPLVTLWHSWSLVWSDRTAQAAFLPSSGVLLPQRPAPNSFPPNPGVSTQVLTSGQLRIIHVSPEDAGNYFCIAQNSAGSALGKTRLVVQGGPRGCAWG